jgi:hypothetical protein
MACQNLATRYATETGNTIPNSTASVDVRGVWLLQQEFGCVEPDGTVNYLPPTDGKSCENTSVYVSPYQMTGVPRTQLKESGFLAWVNERGMQCINRLTGLFTDVANIPNVSVSQPMTYCNTACYNVLAGNQTCLQCIKQTLEDPANNLQDACPALFNGGSIKTVDTNLMNESLSCHGCIGNNSNNLTIPVQTVVDGVNVLSSRYNESAFNMIWGCVSGSFPSQLSVGAIIGIVIACIIVVIIVIVGGYFGWQHEQQKANQKITKNV